MRKIRKIQTVFSVVILLTNPFLGLNVISYAETDNVLEAQTDEQTQTTESEAEVPTEPKEVETPPSSEKSEITDTSVTEETLEETSNEGSELVEEATQEKNQGQTRDGFLRSSRIKLSMTEIQKMADFLQDYLEMTGQTEGVGYVSHTIFIAMLENQLALGNISEITDKLGWEKGAKIQKKFVISNSDFEITGVDTDGEASMTIVPDIKDKDGVKYEYFDTSLGLFKLRSLALSEDESVYYEFVESSDEKVFYSEDKTICYKLNIKSDQMVLDVERVQAKTSTNIISEGISDSEIFIKLNENFQTGYISDGTLIGLSKLPVVNIPFSYSFFQNRIDIETIESPKIKTYAKENISLVLNDDPEKLDLSEFVSVSNTMKETVGNESQISYEWLSKPDTSKIGKTTGIIKTTEKYGEYVNTDTAEVSFTIINDQLSAETTTQTIPLGTATDSLDLSQFVKNVKLGDQDLTSEQYSVKLVDTLTTDLVGKQTVKVEISLNSDPAVKVNVDVPVEIVGTLTIEVPDTLEFQDVKLAKKEQIGQRKTEKPTGFKVTDSRGAGKQGGWYVTAQAITVGETTIDDYLIYKQINGVSENLTDTVKIHQQEVQDNTEGPMTVDLTSWWTDSSGILLKIPKENTLRPNMDYQATLVFNIIEAP
ncbi:hypothetical protein QL848_002612 [Enterococcus faecium]|nr:hypothetical protein [Enterococcus faecium]